ncbi:MAG: hypothetical protein EB015_03180 [Methylocystaceae bacterium]|jgi:hypothetical protein|nr:hypothetical protein [Methylocystaceae bacterium]
MNKYAIITAAALLVASASPSFASCDTRNEDEQAVCASKCEDAYLKDQQSITADMTKVKGDKKACDAKCGCPQNTRN